MDRPRIVLPLAGLLVALLSVHCGGAPTEAEGLGATSSAMSSTIHSSYGVTTFGGAGDYQSVACGGNSKTIDQWYVASSQRYGCHVHLKVTVGSKCVVVYTADAGPATFVESHAGIAVLDSSPTVTKYLFGENALGWEDIKDNPGKYVVHAEVTTEPVGPCSGGGASSGGDDTSDDPPAATVGSSASDAPSSGGDACSSDGDCNPGDDGAGMICKSGTCVPGCKTNAQCPGVTRCVSGQCK